jgi:hypothetical protein
VNKAEKRRAKSAAHAQKVRDQLLAAERNRADSILLRAERAEDDARRMRLLVAALVIHYCNSAAVVLEDDLKQAHARELDIRSEQGAVRVAQRKPWVPADTAAGLGA